MSEDQSGDEAFEGVGVGLVKGIALRTVHIENPINGSGLVKYRHHDFRLTSTVTGNMTGESMDVRNDQCSALACGGPTDPLAKRNTQAP